MPTDVAELLKLNRHIVYNLIGRGELPAIRVGSRRVRIVRSDLEALLEGASAPLDSVRHALGFHVALETAAKAPTRSNEGPAAVASRSERRSPMPAGISPANSKTSEALWPASFIRCSRTLFDGGGNRGSFAHREANEASGRGSVGTSSTRPIGRRGQESGVVRELSIAIRIAGRET